MVQSIVRAQKPFHAYRSVYRALSKEYRKKNDCFQQAPPLILYFVKCFSIKIQRTENNSNELEQQQTDAMYIGKLSLPLLDLLMPLFTHQELRRITSAKWTSLFSQRITLDIIDQLGGNKIASDRQTVLQEFDQDDDDRQGSLLSTKGNWERIQQNTPLICIFQIDQGISRYYSGNLASFRSSIILSLHKSTRIISTFNCEEPSNGK